jgi:hypothetical protein
VFSFDDPITNDDEYEEEDDDWQDLVNTHFTNFIIPRKNDPKLAKVCYTEHHVHQVKTRVC